MRLFSDVRVRGRRRCVARGLGAVAWRWEAIGCRWRTRGTESGMRSLVHGHRKPTLSRQGRLDFWVDYTLPGGTKVPEIRVFCDITFDCRGQESGSPKRVSRIEFHIFTVPPLVGEREVDPLGKRFAIRRPLISLAESLKKGILCQVPWQSGHDRLGRRLSGRLGHETMALGRSLGVRLGVTTALGHNTRLLDATEDWGRLVLGKLGHNTRLLDATEDWGRLLGATEDWGRLGGRLNNDRRLGHAGGCGSFGALEDGGSLGGRLGVTTAVGLGGSLGGSTGTSRRHLKNN
jgi:hypothetical protein